MEICKRIKHIATTVDFVRYYVLLAIFLANTSVKADNNVGFINGTLSVNELGAAVYTVPLEIYPSGTGFDPQIGIAYNSQQSGYGNVGYGTNITGISCITRAGKDLFHDNDVQKVKYEAGDNYLLDGKRLYLKDGKQGTDGSTYTVEGNPYAIVTLHGNDVMSSTSAWFELKDADGTVFQYGKTLRCNFGYPSASYKNVAWYITKSTNKYNDCITYAYSQEDNYMYPTTIAYGREGERHAVIFSYYNLSCPQTFVLEGGATGRIFKRLAYVTSECSSNIYRKYSFNYTLADASPRKYDRLTTITVANGKNETLKPITFDWEYLKEAKISTESLSVPNLKQKSDEHGKCIYSIDMNGDGISDIINLSLTNNHNMTSARLSIMYSSRSASTGGIQYIKSVIKDFSDMRIDESYFDFFQESYFAGNISCNIDGDIYPDIFLPYYNVSYSNKDEKYKEYAEFHLLLGKEITERDKTATTFRYAMKAIKQFPLYKSLDLNGDGKDEIIYVEQKAYNGYYYGKILSNFNFSQQTEASVETYDFKFTKIKNKDLNKMFLLDCNADGLLDILLLFDSGYKIYFNNGGTNLSTVFSESNTKEVLSSSTLKDYWRIEQGDFNGDGLIDFIVNEKNEWKISFLCNNGNGTFTKTGTTEVDFIDKNTDKDDGRYAIRVADFDKDGRSDFMISKEDLGYHGGLFNDYYSYRKTQIRWFKSDGIKPLLWQSIDKNRDADDSNECNIFTGDFDGDGYTEIANYGALLNSATNNVFIDNTINIYKFATDITLGRIVCVTNGLGESSTITYSCGTNPAVYSADYTNDNKFPIKTCTIPLPLVSKLKLANGAADAQEFSYNYKNLRMHVQGRGLLGFSNICIHNNTLESLTETTVERLDENLLIPTAITTREWNSGRNSYSRRTNCIVTGCKNHSWNGNYFSFCKENIYTDFDGYETKTIYEYDVEKGVPSMECIFYDGNDAMYKKTQYISYVLQSGKYVPTSIIYTQKHIDDNTPYTVKNTYSYDGFGNILKNVTSSVYKNNTVTLTTTYTRDSYGNIESEVVEGDNVVSIKKLYEYNTDTKLRLIKSHTNPASVTTTYEYDSWGKLTAKNDISNASNTITTTYAYDDWSNLVKTTNPDGTQTNIKYTCYDQPYYRASTYKTSTTGKSPETVCYDSKGREISSDKIGLDGVSIYRKNIYNAQGKIARVLQKTGSITSWQSFEYDNFGRITAINSPDNTKTTFSHSGRNLYTEAPTGLTKKVYDAWGNTIEVSEYTQSFTPSNKTGTIKYTYCSIGKPVEIVNSGNAITIEYDGAGRKTKLTDPDAGTQTYAYAADGTLLSLTDGRGVTTTYTYDKLGRQVKKICGNIIQTTTFGTSGNALNRVISEECNNGMKEEFEYDNIGRIVNRKRTNENRTFKTSYKYNNKGQLQSIVYPGDVIVEYTYDSNGYMIKASANGKCYFRQGEYGEYDALINKTYFGNLVCKKRFYKHDGTTAYKTIGFSENEELDRINYSYKNSNVECRWRGCITGDFKDEWQKYIDFGYGWETDQDAWQEFIESNDYKYGLDPDPDYNYDYSSCGWEIHGDVVLPKPNKDLYTVEHFTYDYLDRLTAVSKDAPNSTFENIDIKYDVNGNIIYKTGIGSYKYNAVQPHAVSEIEPQTNESGTMHIMPHNIEYNDEGKVSRIYRLPDQRFRANGPISSYIYYYYGPNTEKWKSVDLKRINERIITAKTIYYFDNYEYVEDNSPYEQYFLDNGVILIKKDGQLNFYQAFCDNQGSILSVFDEEGNKVFDASYDAWGKQTVTQNDIDLRYGYCGHEMLNEFGLINMTGRIYDPEIGRFISCDNFVQQPDNIQNFNRYSYCLNNPMKYIDPSGEIFGIDDAIIIGVALTVGGAYIGGSVANKNFNPAKWNFSAAETYCGIVVGAACGYALSAGVGISLGVSYSTSMSTVSINLGNIFSTAGTFLNTYGADITLGLATAAGGGFILSLKDHMRDIQLYTTAVVTSFTVNTYKEDICANTKIDNNKFSDYIEPEALNNDLALIYRPEYYEDIDDSYYNVLSQIDERINRLSIMTRDCKPGFVYHLAAQHDGYYPNLREGGTVYLKAGETWKIGETTNPDRRYSRHFLYSNDLNMIRTSEYMINKCALWLEENKQQREYFRRYKCIPPGNKYYPYVH